MGLNDIEKPSLRYKLLKLYAGFWHNHVFYKNVVVKGSEHIPENGHLIFTANHQNALMDALALLFNVDYQLVFLARSDIFKKKFLASILYFLKILPVYRIRDGYETLKKNESVFKKTIDVIVSHNGIGILPEGNHSGLKRLRPLKKGFARIAFQTEEANGFHLGLQIVPVGIEYEHYQNFRTNLFLQFGKPLSVASYIDLYQKEPAIAINLIKDDLSAAIKPLIVDIESLDYYELYEELLTIYLGRMGEKMSLPNTKQPNKILAEQEIVRQLKIMEGAHPEQMLRLQKWVLEYNNMLGSVHLRDGDIDHKKIRPSLLFLKMILHLILFPVFCFGWMSNILPFRIAIWGANKIEDPQFQSSIKYVISLLAFPIFYLTQTLVVGIITGSWAVAAVYLLSMPIWTTFSWKYYKSILRIRQQWRLLKISGREGMLLRLQEKKQQIIELLDQYNSF